MDNNEQLIPSNDDKFVYTEGSLSISDTVCDGCIYYDSENKNTCEVYPDGKPEEIMNNSATCSKYKEEFNILED